MPGTFGHDAFPAQMTGGVTTSQRGICVKRSVVVVLDSVGSPLRSYRFQFLETNNRLDEIFALLCAALLTQSNRGSLFIPHKYIYLNPDRQQTAH